MLIDDNTKQILVLIITTAGTLGVAYIKAHSKKTADDEDDDAASGRHGKPRRKKKTGPSDEPAVEQPAAEQPAVEQPSDEQPSDEQLGDQLDDDTAQPPPESTA